MGGSDAKMLMQIANLNEVPKSAYKRMAVCNGLIPHEQFTNRAMDYGNFIEDCVYRHLHANDERWQSNPCLVSNKYSRDNVKCIDHVDFLLQDDDKRVLTIGECKATKFTFQQTRHEYEAQLMHHYLMGMELAEQLGGYKLIVLLCHYDTSATNIEEDFVFDENKLTVKCAEGRTAITLASHPRRIVWRLRKQSRRGRRGPFRRVDGNRHGTVRIVMCDFYSVSAAQPDCAKCVILLTS